MALPESLPSSYHLFPDHQTTLPVAHELAIGTWFARKTREQALQLLQDKAIQVVAFHKNMAGALFADHIEAFITAAQGQGKHPFVFRDGHCSQCLSRRGGGRCRHITALALVTLGCRDQGLRPLGLAFPSSPWAQVGTYLYERASLAAPALSLEPEGDQIILRGHQADGFSLCIRLAPEAATELVTLHHRLFPDDAASIPPDRITRTNDLINRLTNSAATANERVLNANGQRSKQQHREESFWFSLARLCWLHLDENQLEIQRDQDGRFQIIWGKAPLFALTLARHHTWELLGRLDQKLTGLQPLPPASRFARVAFDDAGKILHIRYHCRQGKHQYSLEELEPCRYGNHYIKDNQVFSLASEPPADRLHHPDDQPVSLLTFVHNSTVRRLGFTVAPEHLAAFLQQNEQQLQSGRHQVDPAVLDIQFVSVPKKLRITRYREEPDWIYLSGCYDLGNQQIDLVKILTKGTKTPAFLSNRTWFKLQDSPLAWFHTLGPDRVHTHADGSTSIRLRPREMLMLGSQIQQITRPRGHQRRSSLLKFLAGNSPPRMMELALPEHLRTYQVNGTTWLAFLHQYGLGGILADDMGLGKTHQALALLQALATQDTTSHFLLVCPTAVLYHWPQKQERFFPDLSLAVYHGPRRDLEKTWNQAQVLVTTYGVLRSDHKKLAARCFTTIIFDEMHYLKNTNTNVHRAALALQSSTFFGLTGTPLENNLTELEALLAICLPGLFDNRRFRHRYIRNDSAEHRRELARIIRPFILRRTRDQVLGELPARSEDILFCRLSDDQVAAYRQAVNQAKSFRDDLTSQTTPLKDFSFILATITRLKQICNHLCLLEQCTDWQRYRSGKWDEWVKLTQTCLEAGLKMVVFSQYVAMLDLMESYLAAQKIPCIALRGSLGAKSRQQAIERFNTDPAIRICCASLLAGGTGIDLTGAQVVVHFDRWWNPAREEQATARVHRMGQQQPVQVYKLVTVGTLEEKIHALLSRKQALAREIIGEDDGSILKQLHRDELASLLQ